MSRFSFFCRYICLATVLALLSPALWAAWPSESNWIALQNGGSAITDTDDAPGSRDIVGDANNPAVYIFNDGAHLYFRIRVDEDPSQGTGLEPFGWGVLIDTDLNADDYEYLIMLDGIVNPEEFYLAKNTTKTYISDPSDKAETIVWSELAGRADPGAEASGHPAVTDRFP